MRVENEPVYVLHTRPYRESSQLVDLLSLNHGRIRVVARGSRRGGKRSLRLSPFTPYTTDWSGRGELKTLLTAEAGGNAVPLQGDRLYTGFYLNELLIRMLPEQDPHPEIHQHYHQLVAELAGMPETGLSTIEPMLRQFELHLLQQLGYQLVLDTDVITGESIVAECDYLFVPEQGLQGTFDQRTADHRALFNGADLLAMARSDYRQTAVLRSAKRLMRLALSPHLGSRPLHSRELFSQTMKK